MKYGLSRKYVDDEVALAIVSASYGIKGTVDNHTALLAVDTTGWVGKVVYVVSNDEGINPNGLYMWESNVWSFLHSLSLQDSDEVENKSTVVGVKVSDALETLETEDLSFLKLDGSRKMSGDLDLDGNNIVGVDEIKCEQINENTLHNGVTVEDVHLKDQTLYSDLKTDRWSNDDTNTLLGVNVCGLGNLVGAGNTVIGHNALLEITTGHHNIALGPNTLMKSTVGESNIAVGQGALGSNIIGNCNIAVGRGAGSKNTGSNNVFIGHNVAQAELGSNRLHIGNGQAYPYLIYGEFDNRILKINNKLNVDIIDEYNDDVGVIIESVLIKDGEIDTDLLAKKHDKLHSIDDVTEHNGVGGAVEDNLMSFDANGLPKDSGKDSSDFLAVDTSQRLTWRVAPTENDVISLIGWYIKTNTAANLSNATPITAGEAGYHSHFVMDISGAVGLPFDITITGCSINESTGVTTLGDTEVVNVTGNGNYQSVKSWIDAVVFTVIAGKSCTVDIYRTTYWDRGNKNFTVSGSRMEWKPDAGNWEIRLEILKVNNDGSITIIDDTTFTNGDAIPRAANGKYGKYKRLNYSTVINGTNKEGIIVRVDVTNISDFYTEVKYHE